MAASAPRAAANPVTGPSTPTFPDTAWTNPVATGAGHRRLRRVPGVSMGLSKVTSWSQLHCAADPSIASSEPSPAPPKATSRVRRISARLFGRTGPLDPPAGLPVAPVDDGQDDEIEGGDPAATLRDRRRRTSLQLTRCPRRCASVHEASESEWRQPRRTAVANFFAAIPRLSRRPSSSTVIVHDDDGRRVTRKWPRLVRGKHYVPKSARAPTLASGKAGGFEQLRPARLSAWVKSRLGMRSKPDMLDVAQERLARWPMWSFRRRPDQAADCDSVLNSSDAEIASDGDWAFERIQHWRRAVQPMEEEGADDASARFPVRHEADARSITSVWTDPLAVPGEHNESPVSRDGSYARQNYDIWSHSRREHRVGLQLAEQLEILHGSGGPNHVLFFELCRQAIDWENDNADLPYVAEFIDDRPIRIIVRQTCLTLRSLARVDEYVYGLESALVTADVPGLSHSAVTSTTASSASSRPSSPPAVTPAYDGRDWMRRTIRGRGIPRPIRPLVN